jgi:HlyD family secretion protein
VKRLLALLVVLAAAGATYWFVFRAGEEPLTFQGYIEGNLVFMAAEEGGRIERLEVEAGDQVAEGQLLFALESSVQVAQRNEAEARWRQAQAQLENLKAAQQRPEQIAVLRAQEERARAQLQFSKNEFERQQMLFQRGISAKAQLDQARSAFERDTAAVEEAGRQIEAAQLAGRAGEIGSAEAAAHAAEAAFRQAETKIAKRRVSTPAAARVQDVYFRAGEVVNPGQPVLALLPPANLKVRFYVPETVLSTLSLGQVVPVSCDSCGEGFSAKITFISREAEFTPPVIFSDKERAKLVFRAEARPVAEVRVPIGLPVTVSPPQAGSSR